MRHHTDDMPVRALPDPQQARQPKDLQVENLQESV